MRHALMLAAVLVASTALAAAAPAPAAKSPPPKTSGSSAPAGSAADEDEDEPPKTAQPTPPPAPAPAALGAVSTGSDTQQQKLVSGAPLYNPNVAVHIVEQKEYTDKWKREVFLFGAAQVNGKFTNHFGAGLGFTWHLQENFGLQVMGLWNAYNAESPFNGELIDKVRAEAQAATSLLLIGGALGGVEVTPLYGKFVFYDSYLVHFSLVLSAGAGAGVTRHQLKPNNDAGPATYGETGARFLAEIGAGFRVQFLKWLTFRLELRDIVYTAKVDSVNGCTNSDLKAMDTALRGGQGVKSANVGAGCNVDKFDGVEDYGDDDPANDRKRSDDVPLAFALVKNPSSDVLNNLGIYAGFSFTF